MAQVAAAPAYVLLKEQAQQKHTHSCTLPRHLKLTTASAAVEHSWLHLHRTRLNACTAFAVAAAAETAMAAALQVDVQQCSISVQALFFCTPNAPIRSCDAGWSLQDALQQLQQRGQKLPTAACLPYKPDTVGDQSAEALCKGSCSNPSTHAGRGKFSSQRITVVWKAQRHIRQYGSVVSRFGVSQLALQLLSAHDDLDLYTSPPALRKLLGFDNMCGNS